MATSLPIKRMTRERVELQKSNPDYFAYFKDDDLLAFEAYVVGPEDTLYQHKFVKLRFEIPHRYPMVPPVVTFIQHSGGRIHPNLYVEGKVCLSILGTWAGEPWAFGMNCHTVLITIRSLLDNQPFKHEPSGADNPAFNKYVEYSTWRCLLLDYLRNERAEPARAFLHDYVSRNRDKIFRDLAKQDLANRDVKLFTSPYQPHAPARSGLAQSMQPDYPCLIGELTAAIPAATMLGAESAGAAKHRREEDAIRTPDQHLQKRLKEESKSDSNDLEAPMKAINSSQMPKKATPSPRKSSKGAREIIDLT